MSITSSAESVEATPSPRRASRDGAGGRARQKCLVCLHADDTLGLIRGHRCLTGKGDYTLAPREARARIVGGHPEAAASTLEGSAPKRPQLATHVATIRERGAPGARHDPQSIRLEQATSKGETQAERLIAPVNTIELGTEHVTDHGQGDPHLGVGLRSRRGIPPEAGAVVYDGAVLSRGLVPQMLKVRSTPTYDESRRRLARCIRVDVYKGVSADDIAMDARTRVELRIGRMLCKLSSIHELHLAARFVVEDGRAYTSTGLEARKAGCNPPGFKLGERAIRSVI